nr:MAG TPA: hypothetical protein [Caudoviricetes sp.]DAZ71278.1 MAG TPA: hypothetical protein [Caudoviricetes sp.]
MKTMMTDNRTVRYRSSANSSSVRIVGMSGKK